jgi:hypothetical protein
MKAPDWVLMSDTLLAIASKHRPEQTIVGQPGAHLLSAPNARRSDSPGRNQREHAVVCRMRACGCLLGGAVAVPRRRHFPLVPPRPSSLGRGPCSRAGLTPLLTAFFVSSLCPFPAACSRPGLTVPLAFPRAARAGVPAVGGPAGPGGGGAVQGAERPGREGAGWGGGGDRGRGFGGRGRTRVGARRAGFRDRMAAASATGRLGVAREPMSGFSPAMPWPDSAQPCRGWMWRKPMLAGASARGLAAARARALRRLCLCWGVARWAGPEIRLGGLQNAAMPRYASKRVATSLLWVVGVLWEAGMRVAG